MPKSLVTDWDSTPGNNTDIAGINIGEGCPAAGINDAIRTVMSQLATYIGGGIATVLDWAVGTSTNKFFTPSSLLAAVQPQVISDSATITVDLATGLRFSLTKAINGSMALTNAKVGYTYNFMVKQDATGSRTLSKPTAAGVTVVVKGGTFALSTTANTYDRFSVEIWSSTLYFVTPSKGYS